LKILDVARNLIRLSGFVPDEEIPITFIGLRPGEKLREQLIGEGETLEAVEAGRIFRVQWPNTTETDISTDRISMLIGSATQGQALEVVAHLRTIVPNFTPMAPHLAETRTATTFPSVSTVQPQRLRGGGPSPSHIAVATSAPPS
jgi:FlaA1/EpsC-like NDP-sugar epimerase